MARILPLVGLMLSLVVCIAHAEVYQFSLSAGNGNNLNLACKPGPVLPKSTKVSSVVSTTISGKGTSNAVELRLEKVLGGYGIFIHPPIPPPYMPGKK